MLLGILFLFLLSIATGCKIQSVDQYHETEKTSEIEVENNIAKNNSKDEKLSKEEIDSQKENITEEKNTKKEPNEDASNKNEENKSNNTTKTEIKKTNTSTSTTTKKNTSDTKTPIPNQGNKDKDEIPNKPVAPPKENPKKYVTLSIRCDTILKNYGKLDPALKSEKFVPSNGVILKKSQFELKDGENVFDILVKATRKHRIHMEYQGADQNKYGSVYIQGINNLYEFSCGELSGWMYNVNGTYPNVGASAYKVKDGDHIQWNYTCDLGRDLGTSWLKK